jgi:tyrosine-protein phosphatase SIW14
MKPQSRLIAALFLGLPIWAASVPGIENFYQIDPQVYRGAQPTAQGFQYLSSLGVKTVIDLREHDQRSAIEERWVTAAGMKYVNVPMTGMTPPTAAEIGKILGLMENSVSGPVFVHCKRGADRTGAVVASYRIDHDHWDNSRALKEAMSDKMSGFQHQRQNYIRAFQPSTQAVSADASATAPVIAAATEDKN